jgi:hypothetical protein
MMALPATITSTFSWPDHTNSMVGPFDYNVPAMVLSTDYVAAPSSTQYAKIGWSATPVLYHGQSFQLGADATVGRVALALAKNGALALTDSLIVEIRTDDGTGNAWTTTVLATATLGIGSLVAIGTNASGAWISGVLDSQLALTAGTRYWIVAHRSGAATTSYPAWIYTATAYTGGQRASQATAGGAITADATTDLSFVLLDISRMTPSVYALCVDKTNNVLTMMRSTDSGNTWAEADASHHPAITVTAGYKNVSVSQLGALLVVGCATGTGTPTGYLFSADMQTWGGFATAGGTGGLDVNGNVPVFYIVRSSDGVTLGVHQAPTVKIGATNYRRIKIVTATGVLDVISGTAADNGNSVHYDLRYVLQGSAGRVHTFWTQSDATGLRCRTYNADGTWGAAHTTGTNTCGNGTGYPVGIGNTYASGGNTFLAVPFVDGAALKVATCDSSLATVATNWTVATISAAAPETTNSNPCCLASDQTKLWAWVVTAGAGRYLQWADNGSGSWGILTPFRGNTAIVANGVSARMLSNAIGVVYLDGTAIKYDRMAVFAPKVSNAAGATVETVYDLGDPAGAPSIDIVPDVSEAGAAITGLVEIQIEHSGDNGGWTELGHVTVDSGTIGGPLTFGPVMQFIKVTTTTTGAASSGGVAGV